MTKLFHSVALGKFCSSGLCKGVWRTRKEPQCAILLPGKLHLGLEPPPTCLSALPPSQLRSAIRMLSRSLQLLGLPSGRLPQPLQHVLMVLTQGNHLVWAREIRELCQHQSPICQTAPTLLPCLECLPPWSWPSPSCPHALEEERLITLNRQTS